MLKKTVAFLGAGSMAEAMISGMVASEKLPADQIIVTNRQNKERLNELQMKYGIRAVQRDQLDYTEVDLFILAMKPKDVDDVLASIKDRVTEDQVVLSVMAGISTAYMEENLKPSQQVIRVMPNTSSMIRESSTAISPGKHVSLEEVTTAKTLLQSIGEVFVIKEEQMDVFTGIAGSGPAYFYHLMEHIENAGSEAGLSKEMCREMGAQTILGAAKMILQQEDSPAELRKKVTSPNGTTAAGLQALREHGGGQAIYEAVKGATNRSKEMSRQLERPVALNK